MYKNNVIDLNNRLKQKANMPSASKASEPKATTEVLDMTVRREAILSDERREVRRTILTGFIGAYVVIPSLADTRGGLLKVDIYDISENGIAFDMDESNGHFKVGEEVAMRVYLSQDTYFPFIISIQNQRQLTGEASYRHGAHFLKGSVNDEALYHFVKFIETVSASLEKDKGDVMVSGLKK
ncbi:MAG: PilZ domain-containing protein [Bdellovibrionales bacterium]|nr:PilZ domain-containing protein [Bdellovibrionales bacterium]